MLKIAERWYERRRISDDITLIWEPHVHSFLRCNIWHVRGRDADLLVDTGLGVVSLKDAIADLIDRGAGLQAFLQLLGAPPPRLAIVPQELSFEAGVGDAAQQVTLTLANEGRGYLAGRIIAIRSWRLLRRLPSLRAGRLRV